MLIQCPECHRRYEFAIEALPDTHRSQCVHCNCLIPLPGPPSVKRENKANTPELRPSPEGEAAYRRSTTLTKSETRPAPPPVEPVLPPPHPRLLRKSCRFLMNWLEFLIQSLLIQQIFKNCVVCWECHCHQVVKHKGQSLFHLPSLPFRKVPRCWSRHLRRKRAPIHFYMIHLLRKKQKKIKASLKGQFTNHFLRNQSQRSRAAHPCLRTMG